MISKLKNVYSASVLQCFYMEHHSSRKHVSNCLLVINHRVELLFLGNIVQWKRSTSDGKFQDYHSKNKTWLIYVEYSKELPPLRFVGIKACFTWLQIVSSCRQKMTDTGCYIKKEKKKKNSSIIQKGLLPKHIRFCQNAIFFTITFKYRQFFLVYTSTKQMVINLLFR